MPEAELIDPRHDEPDPQGDGFEVTLQVRAKHADLLRAAKKIGSVKALAEHLGVHLTTVHLWIALRRVPSIFGSTYSPKTWGDPQWVAALEKKLFDLTGKTLDQLFPEAVRSKDFLDIKKTTEITREVDLEQLRLHQHELLALPAPDEEASRDELKRAIRLALKSLTRREQQIVQMRFGMTDGHIYTLEEVGRAFKVTAERIRGLEIRALRKLRDGPKSIRAFAWRYQFHCRECEYLWAGEIGDDQILPCPLCKQPITGREVEYGNVEISDAGISDAGIGGENGATENGESE